MGAEENGRIKCIFSRKRDDYTDDDEIFDLNEDHYLFLAKGKVDDRGKLFDLIVTCFNPENCTDSQKHFTLLNILIQECWTLLQGSNSSANWWNSAIFRAHLGGQ